MKTFSVKEIAEMLNTNPETVRRWIRSGKLEAIQDSRKEGNVITEQMLNVFLKSSPKYAGALTASTGLSSIAEVGVLTISILGGLVAQQYVKNENAKKARVSIAEIKKLLNVDIKSRTQTIRRKEETIRQLKNEIENEKAAIEEARRIIKEMDEQITRAKEGED